MSAGRQPWGKPCQLWRDLISQCARGEPGIPKEMLELDSEEKTCTPLLLSMWYETENSFQSFKKSLSKFSFASVFWVEGDTERDF